ncbi:MAG: oxidoreductase [Puniceicoccaceae bacterium]|nr:MAG: oxidoreductase [Puniceicoccaceae bacterium]
MAAAVAVPTAGALAAFLLPNRWRAAVGLGFSVLTLLATFALAAGVTLHGPQDLFLGGWAPPLGIRLHLDGLAAVFLAMTALVAIPVGIYARTFFAAGEGSGSTDQTHLFWPLWLILWAGMNGVYLSADLFNLYVMIEVTGISAVALAVLSGKVPALTAGLRYLLAALVGSLSYLMGVALMYGTAGALDLALVAEAMDRQWTLRVAMGLLLVGLMVKTALFPLHFWLPAAHSAALPPVSAILSALVVKATFYLILRFWVEVFEGSVTIAASQAMGGLGAAAILWGSYQALRQERLKLIVAHSTVGQLGFLFLLLPLITVDATAAEAPWLAWAWHGGIYQALAHAFAKASLFLAVGIFVIAVGSDDRRASVDLVGRLPMTTFAFGLAGMSLIGLPPSGGFVAKWMLLKATFASGQWWWAPVIVAGSFLTAGYVFGILRQAFAPSERRQPLRQVPKTLEICALALAVLAILIGFRSEEVLTLLDIGVPFAEPAPPEGSEP